MELQAPPDDIDHLMGSGPDMMDIMKQTASELNGPSIPDLIPQTTTNVTSNENALIGTPLNSNFSTLTSASSPPTPAPAPAPLPPPTNMYKSPPNNLNNKNKNKNNNNNILAGPTINIGGYNDDFDENYDIKDDLTQEQQNGMAHKRQFILAHIIFTNI